MWSRKAAPALCPKPASDAVTRITPSDLWNDPHARHFFDVTCGPLKGLKDDMNPSFLKAGRSCQGFSLIELMVVLCIILIVAGLLLSVLGAAQSKARESQCLNNLRQHG